MVNLLAGSLRGWRHHAAIVVLVSALTETAWAADKNQILYIGGTISGDYARAGGTRFPSGEERPVAALYAFKIPGRISTAFDSDFVFDAGRNGTLAIPYRKISSLVYGPAFQSSGAPTKKLKYRWSGFPHRSKPYLSILFEDHTGKLEHVVFDVGENLVSQTFRALEIGAGRELEFQTITACLYYKKAEECGGSSTAALKGLRKVFVDTTGSTSEIREQIIAEITKARLDLEMVAKPENAEVILNFAGLGWFREIEDSLWYVPIPSHGRGEVYVARDHRLSVVILFDEEYSLWKRKLGASFAKTFVKEYKRANGVR